MEPTQKGERLEDFICMLYEMTFTTQVVSSAGFSQWRVEQIN